MRRLLNRAAIIFGIYIALLLAVGIAGFLGQTAGIWTSILWGAGLITAIAIYGWRRVRRPRPSA